MHKIYDDISMGTIVVTHRNNSYGCRVKFYPNINVDTRYIMISIPQFEIVLDRTRILSSRTRKRVIEWCRRNQELILMYWNFNVIDDESFWNEQIYIETIKDDDVLMTEISYAVSHI